jgi:hypothetical protein
MWGITDKILLHNILAKANSHLSINLQLKPEAIDAELKLEAIVYNVSINGTDCHLNSLQRYITNLVGFSCFKEGFPDY